MTPLEKVMRRAESDAKSSGCCLNPDLEILEDLLRGLKKNEERYGYNSCPCRLASGIFEYDRDIICPCDYRDPDVEEFGTCYCGLYISKDVFEGKKPLQSIPERRPKEKQDRAYVDVERIIQEKKTKTRAEFKKETYGTELKLFYCRHCGYVIFREDPPYVCPICKAKREMFSKITIQARAS